MADSVSFYVQGIPKTKGSTRWAAVVRLNARRETQRPFTEPVRVDVTFYLPRPKTHYKRGVLRDDAPRYVAGGPNINKLIHCVLDALIGVCYLDGYVADDGNYGVEVRIRQAGTR